MRPQSIVTTALASLFLALPIVAVPLEATEQRIVAWVDAHADEAVATLAELVEINSGTQNVEGVRAVGEALQPRFEAMGFATRWEEMPDAMGRAGHLWAERVGSAGRSVLLIGHLDTVFEPDHPFQDFERDGDLAHGPGVNDMKGGDVAVLYALEALASVGALEGRTISVVFTGDEERVGDPIPVARAGLVEQAQAHEVALGFETGSRDEEGQQYATIARRSSTGWALTVEGRQAHSSGIFSQESGSGAIFEAARILWAFHEELREPGVTFNAGVLVGGTDVRLDPATSQGEAYGKTNVIPQRVLVRGGLRTLTQEQLEGTREKMRQIVARHLPRTEAAIEFEEGYPPMAPTAANRELLATLNEINRDLGAPEMLAYDPSKRGAADISFAAPHVGASLAALGAFGSGAHSPEESIDLSLLPLVTKRAALLVYRLTR